MNETTLLVNQHAVLAALLLLGEATASDLAALLEVDPQSLNWEILTIQPGIGRTDERFFIDSEGATLLADLFQKGEFAEMFAALFNRHATRLMQEDATGFQNLVERVARLSLDHPQLGNLRMYFAAVALARQDRYSEAITQLEQLLNQPTLDMELRGRALNSQSIYWQITGQIERAVVGYRASLDLWRALNNRTREGMALLNLGILDYQLQQYAEAEDFLLQAAQCFLTMHNEYQLGSVQNQLGLVYHDQGLLDEALACFDAVATQRRAIADFESLGRALNNRGEVLLFQGKWEAAEVDFVEALGKLQARTFAIDGHLNLGLTRQVRGDFGGAQQMYQRALDIALAIGRRDILAEIHYRLGDVARRMNDDATALAQLEAAAAVIESSQSGVRSEQLRIGLLGRWQQIYEALVLHCWQTGDWQRAFDWAERARARAFADALQGAPANGAAALPTELQGETSEILGQLLAALANTTTLLCYFTTGVLEQEMPFLATLKRDHPLRQHLLVPAHILCFALHKGELTIRDCQLDPNALTTLSPRQDRSRLLAAAVLKRLYVQLLPSELAGIDRLIIAPHGPLHQIPFAALLDNNNQPLLQEEGPALSYTPSGSILLHRLTYVQVTPIAACSCLAVGCDVRGAWGDLRHTEREAQLIATLCGGTAWVGSLPKLETLRAEAAQVRWLHFACHGWFDAEKPLESYLQTGIDERLLAQEVLSDWQLHADLVTLSACQSGVQKVLRSDEPMGLVRGFLYAGAKAVLATQWPVEDLPTFLLMLYFYRQLTQKETSEPAVALRAAQSWLRTLSNSEMQQIVAELPVVEGELPEADYPFAEPRFWAGFVIYS